MRIGIDCDDVCCNFQKREVELLHEMYGRPPLGTMPIDWEGSNLQVSKEEYDQFWAKSATIANWWADLEPLPSFDAETIDLLHTVCALHDVYFVTNRYPTPGASPMKQTKFWFCANAGIVAPNVVIAKDKGPMATVLQLDCFIDDRPKNCVDVKKARPTAKVYLCDSSHNQPYRAEWMLENDIEGRAKNLKAFLKVIIETEKI